MTSKLVLLIRLAWSNLLFVNIVGIFYLCMVNTWCAIILWHLFEFVVNALFFQSFPLSTIVFPCATSDNSFLEYGPNAIFSIGNFLCSTTTANSTIDFSTKPVEDGVVDSPPNGPPCLCKSCSHASPVKGFHYLTYVAFYLWESTAWEVVQGFWKIDIFGGDEICRAQMVTCRHGPSPPSCTGISTSTCPILRCMEDKDSRRWTTELMCSFMSWCMIPKVHTNAEATMIAWVQENW